MKRNSVKIAVSGGIGSGKSTVANILRGLGFSVLSCDEIYSELLDSGVFTCEFVKAFGEGVVTAGKVDRVKLSKTVFGNRQNLNKLNSITHPVIMKELIERANSFELCFCEVPLLFENAFERLFDGVIVVLRDKEDRINAVAARDGISRENVLKRINVQYNYENSAFAEYYVIHNSLGFDELERSTKQVVKKIKENFKID